MPTTTLVKDLLWRASVLCGDAAPQWQRFTENELVSYLNEGQVVICKYLPSAGTRIDSIKLTAGTRQSIDTIPTANCIPGDGVSLTAPLYGIQLYSLIRNMGADGSTVGKATTLVQRDILDNFNEDWHTATGSAIQDYHFDERLPTTFYVSPAVTGTMWAEISYAAMPKVIPNTGAAGSELYSKAGSSTQTITIHDKFGDDLLNYIMARAQLKDAKYTEAGKAKMYADLFMASLNIQVAALTGHNPNIKTLPGGTAP